MTPQQIAQDLKKGCNDKIYYSAWRCGKDLSYSSNDKVDKCWEQCEKLGSIK